MKTIFIAGTSSSAGKNTIALGIIRLLQNSGKRVAPFKPITMESFDANAGLDITPSIRLQSLAARVEAQHLMNPIRLLHPLSGGDPLLYIRGEYKPVDCLRDSAAITKCVLESYACLAVANEVVVIEGSGALDESIGSSIGSLIISAVIDQSNPSIVLVADEYDGGALAGIIGTLTLIPASWRRNIVGVVFNRVDLTPTEEPLVSWCSLLKKDWGISYSSSFPVLRNIAAASEDLWPMCSPAEVDDAISWIASVLSIRLGSSLGHFLGEDVNAQRVS